MPSILDKIFADHPELEKEINRKVEERMKLLKRPPVQDDSGDSYNIVDKLNNLASPGS